MSYRRAWLRYYPTCCLSVPRSLQNLPLWCPLKNCYMQIKLRVSLTELEPVLCLSPSISLNKQWITTAYQRKDPLPVPGLFCENKREHILEVVLILWQVVAHLTVAASSGWSDQNLSAWQPACIYDSWSILGSCDYYLQPSPGTLKKQRHWRKLDSLNDSGGLLHDCNGMYGWVWGMRGRDAAWETNRTREAMGREAGFVQQLLQKRL